jgi:hypothetical protein
MSTSNSYRVEDKKNVHMNGRRTLFKLFKKTGDAYVFDGEYTASGWDQSDAKCVSAAQSEQDRIEFDDRSAGY